MGLMPTYPGFYRGRNLAPYLLRPVVASKRQDAPIPIDKVGAVDSYYGGVSIANCSVLNGQYNAIGYAQILRRGFAHFEKPLDEFKYIAMPGSGPACSDYLVLATSASFSLRMNLILTDFEIEDLTWANHGGLEYSGDYEVGHCEMTWEEGSYPPWRAYTGNTWAGLSAFCDSFRADGNMIYGVRFKFLDESAAAGPYPGYYDYYRSWGLSSGGLVIEDFA